MVYQKLGINDHDLLRHEIENQQFFSLINQNKWVFATNNTSALGKLNEEIEEVINKRRAFLKKQEEKNRGLLDTIMRFEKNTKTKEDRKIRLIKN